MTISTYPTDEHSDENMADQLPAYHDFFEESLQANKEYLKRNGLGKEEIQPGVRPSRYGFEDGLAYLMTEIDEEENLYFGDLLLANRLQRRRSPRYT